MSADDAKPKRFEWPPQHVAASELNAPAKPLDAGGRYRIVSRSRAAVDDDLGFDEDRQRAFDWDEPEHDVAADGEA